MRSSVAITLSRGELSVLALGSSWYSRPSHSSDSDWLGPGPTPNRPGTKNQSQGPKTLVDPVLATNYSRDTLLTGLGRVAGRPSAGGLRERR